MPDTPTGTIIGYDDIFGKELFRVDLRPITVNGRPELPIPGGTYIERGRRYRVIERREDAFDKMWKITVSDEGPSEDPRFQTKVNIDLPKPR